MRWFLAFLGLSLLVAGVPAVAAPEVANAPPADATPLFTASDCGAIACRSPGGSFIVRTSEGNDSPVQIPSWPYVTKDGTIIIFPGETLTVDFPQMGDTLGLPHFLESPAASGAAIILTITYKYQNVGGKISSFLTLRQTSSQAVKLDAQISVFSSSGLKFEASSTCPLQPNLPSLETWGGELGPILLHNLRFLPKGSPMACT